MSNVIRFPSKRLNEGLGRYLSIAKVCGFTVSEHLAEESLGRESGSVCLLKQMAQRCLAVPWIIPIDRGETRRYQRCSRKEGIKNLEINLYD